MKAKHLIRVLKLIDPETRIYIDGYEAGIEDIISIKQR